MATFHCRWIAGYRSLLFFSLLFFCFFSLNAHASFYQGSKRIFLGDEKGNRTYIGSVEFKTAKRSDIGFIIKIDHTLFKDFFLSMKEMKCLEGLELWCHLPYPHQSPRRITADNLKWLEHELLFMFKDRQSFGANFWNGIYYKLKLDGSALRGDAHYVDLNKLAAPPDTSAPPLGEYDIEPADDGKRWLPYLFIE